MSDAIIYREIKYKDKIQLMVNKVFDYFVDEEIKNYDTILIKPNLMYYRDSSTGETTDPILVKYIIEKIKEILDEDVRIKIIESDASAMKTKYVFNILGYNKLVQNNVELYNLSKGEFVREELDINNRKIKIKLNKLLLEDNYLINIPKIKIHRNPPVLTSALKNNFGLISTEYKYQYHNRLSDYVYGINKIIKNNLIIVDGLVVLGKTPKNMGLIIAAKNPIIADVISCKISGINPYKDQIISRFMSKKNDFKNIKLLDHDNVLLGAINDFPKTNPNLNKITWDILLGLLDLYTKIVGDIKPPILE
jgi:uncharacterized protein (DUF362 family)